MCRCAKIHLRCDRSLSATPHAPLAPLGLLHTCSSGTLGRAYAWTLGLLFARVTASPIESNQGASCYSYVSSLNLNLTSPNNDAGGGMEDNNRAAGSTCTDYSSTDESMAACKMASGTRAATPLEDRFRNMPDAAINDADKPRRAD